jgi:phosphoenolpyruvate synthase/pyruvate phosphate dikinase
MLLRINKIVDVPSGIVITTSVFDNFVDANGCKDDINKLYRKNPKLSSNIRKKIIRGRLDDTLLKDIYRHAEVFRGPFAVRSSCTFEDNSKVSFAGMFDTMLSVKKEDLETAIKRVYLSLYSDRAVNYFNANHIDIRKAKMAVIIQQMAEGSKFGVCFSFIQDNTRTTIIENAIGDPDVVTAGKVNVDRYIIKGNSVEKYPAMPEFDSLFDFEISKINKAISKLSKIVPRLDMEYAIGRGATLKILQLRPITSDIKLPKKGTRLTGIPVSSGKCSGVAVLFDDEKAQTVPKVQLSKETILFTDEISIDNATIIQKVGGLILSYAGITSHAAIIAREYKVPCISGISNLNNLIKPGEKISINGDTGEISFLDRKDFSFENKVKKSLFLPDHTKFGLYREAKHAIVTYPLSSKILAISYSIKNAYVLNSIVLHMEKNFGKQCIDLGPSFYYDVNFMLDLKPLNKGPYMEMAKAWKTLNSIRNVESFYELTKRDEALALRSLSKSNKMFNYYSIKNDKRYLVEALKYADYAYAYWKVIDAVILRNKPAELIYKEADRNKVTKTFERAIINIQADKEVVRVGDMVVKAISKILTEISKDIKVKSNSYSSKYAFISDIKSFIDKNSR